MLTSTTLLSLAAIRPDLWLKLETAAPAGSIKARGVERVVASASQKPAGLTTYSTGNHGIALAAVAKRLTVPCLVLCPPTLAKFKHQTMEKLGATVVASYPDAQLGQAAAADEARIRRWLHVPLAGHGELLAGYATVIDEIAHVLGPAFRLVVPVGTGSLLRACSERVATLGLSVQLTGAEPAAYARFDQITPLAFTSPSLADGLAINLLPNTNRLALRTAALVSVSEIAIAKAMALVQEITGQQIEGAAAVAVAAGLQLPVSLTPVVTLVTGSNIEDTAFTAALAQRSSFT